LSYNDVDETVRQAISSLSIDPGEVQLIVVTHGNLDPIGSAKDIKELTGAKIAMHEQNPTAFQSGPAHLCRRYGEGEAKLSIAAGLGRKDDLSCAWEALRCRHSANGCDLSA
jgi:glyoxylase-like metal-dependent hydrolase (beta-lactamase superfamily II)